MTDEKIEIGVFGMTCGHCASRVEDALSSVSGVKEATVDLGAKKAIIQFDGENTDIENLKKAISDAGYRLE